MTGSKLITNKVFEGFELAEDFLELSGLLPPRSCCGIKHHDIKFVTKMKKAISIKGSNTISWHCLYMLKTLSIKKSIKVDMLLYYTKHPK